MDITSKFSDSQPKDGSLSLGMLLPDSISPWLLQILSSIFEPALGITQLNKMHLDVTKISGTPAEVCLRTLRYLNTEVVVTLEESKNDGIAGLNEQNTGPVVFVCNHPFGGIEALALIVLMSRLCAGPWKVMANEMLRIFPEVADALLFVDPFREEHSALRNLGSLKGCLRFLKNGGSLGVFPAGSVSSFQLKKRQVVDDAWMPSIAKLIQLTKASVVPVHFEGRNSLLFQAVSLMSKKARLGLLVHEFTRNAPCRIDVTCGKLISYSELEHLKTPESLSQALYDRVYCLKDKRRSDETRGLTPNRSAKSSTFMI